jgi:hypothetical protein
LILSSEKLVSKFAFKFNLYRYIEVGGFMGIGGKEEEEKCGVCWSNPVGLSVRPESAWFQPLKPEM